MKCPICSSVNTLTLKQAETFSDDYKEVSLQSGVKPLDKRFYFHCKKCKANFVKEINIDGDILWLGETKRKGKMWNSIPIDAWEFRAGFRDIETNWVPIKSYRFTEFVFR